MNKRQLELAAELHKMVGHSDDFKSELKEIDGQTVILMYLQSLVDTSKTSVFLESFGAADWDGLARQLGAAANQSAMALETALLSGKIVVVHESGNFSWSPFSPPIQRSVTGSRTESNIDGAMDAFIESLNINMGMLRSHLHSRELSINHLTLGTLRKRALSVCYIKGKADENMAQQIISRLSAQKEQEVGDAQDLSRLLGERKKWSAIPLFLMTEQTEQTVSLMMKGRVVVFLDQLPFALIMPPLITDLWCLYSDRNMTQTMMFAIRAVRILSLLVALIIPGLYVALVSINPEAFRIDMALAVAKSREDVPYPAILEVMFMLMIMEMIVGSSIRLPKPIGPAITMVGGIILGQAVVQAKLVSNLMIIILAASTIANFALVGFQNALMIRFFKYGNVILGSIFGALGVLFGVVMFVFYLAGITTFRVPYLGMKASQGNDYD